MKNRVENLSVVFSVVVLVGALASANAQDSDLQFGLRGGANVNQYALGGFPWDMDGRGYGFEAGLAAKYPLTNGLRLNSELIFCYRELVVLYDPDNGNFPKRDYSYEDDYDFGWYYEHDRGSISETTVFIPVMLQFTPVESAPFYVSAGLQLGFPLTNIYKAKYKRMYLDGGYTVEGTYKVNWYGGSRSVVDFGAALGVGYMAAKPKIGVELRYVININNVYGRNMDEEALGTRLMYLTFGVSYFL